MQFAPCFPKDWPQVDLRLTLGPAPCKVTILNPQGLGTGLVAAHLNGTALDFDAGVLTVPLDQLQGELILEIG